MVLHASYKACPLQRAKWLPLFTGRRANPTSILSIQKGEILEQQSKVIKTIGIKLNPTVEQIREMEQLFSAFKYGINWSLTEIEKRYQIFLKSYIEIPKEQREKGTCPECKADKPKLLVFRKVLNLDTCVCVSCAIKSYSEYTVRKEVYGARERVVAEDLKNVVEIPNKTYYTTLFSQSYAIWKSYNAWVNKRKRELEMVEGSLENADKRHLKAAMQIEQVASDIKQGNQKLTWKLAKALASKKVYTGFSEQDRKEIVQLHDKLMIVRRLRRPIHFPQIEKCRTIFTDKGFVKWDGGELSLTIWSKSQRVDYFGKEYLKQYLPMMEKSPVYCNIVIKGGQYYLMYPLPIKVKQPEDIKKCDKFIFISSPHKTAIMGYDKDNMLNTVKWFPTGELIKAKRNFKDKRVEIGRRKNDLEKMRKIRRRRNKIHIRGNLEQRFVSTYSHQLTRKMVDYIMEQSGNPKIIVWDVGNGITQNFGTTLNYLKNLWSVVQQQDYMKHKAMQAGIPIIEVEYNKCNDLTCSKCGAKQANGKKTAKIITQVIKGIKNFTCTECKYEVNMLINQANNIAQIT